MFFLGSATTGCHLDMDIELARLDSAYVNSWRYIQSWFGWCMIRALFHSNCGSQSYGLSLFCRSNAIESQSSCRNPKERVGKVESWWKSVKVVLSLTQPHRFQEGSQDLPRSVRVHRHLTFHWHWLSSCPAPRGASSSSLKKKKISHIAKVILYM